MSNLLLGNGINLNAINKDDFTAEQMSKRFIERFIDSLPIFEHWTGKLNIGSIDELISSIGCDPQLGIEHIADRLFEYIKSKYVKEFFDINMSKRLIEFITAIGLNAIFYKGTKINFPIIPQSFINVINAYEKVFTLNYAEKWDTNSKCTFLHGKYNDNIFVENEKTVLLFDGRRYLNCAKCKSESFISTINNLRDKFNMIQENDLPSIIFTPEAIKKQSNIGLFASDELFPACDLYPENFYQLYFELNGVSSLDIFGMSPHGDEDIISKIKAIRNVTIYVYEKNKNKETIIWAKKIPTAHLRDSNEFLS